MAVPSHHFNKKRGLATGLAVSGVGAGVEGKNHVDISQSQNEKPVDNEKREEDQLDDVEKAPEDKPSFFAAVKVFKDPRFLSLSIAELIASIAFLIPLYYMQTYAVFVGISVERGALILGLSNGASFAGRITLGVISDYVSNAKVLLFCSWCTAFAVLVLWTVSRSFGPLLLMGLMFGFFGGGYISLVPVAVAQSFGTKEIASTIGLMYAGGGLGMLGGAPLAGFLLDITQPNTSYLPVTLTSDEILWAACKDDNLELLDEALSLEGTDVNSIDGLGNTALHYAARQGSKDCMEILLHFDELNVNVANRLEGDTPLHKAAAYEDPDMALIMVELLVNRGASLNAVNKHRQKPVDKAPSDTHEEVKTFLENAALGSYYDSRDIAVEDDDSDGVPSDDE
ncbi:hypothetical protein BGZ79_007707 [Entomortierella chlamydospora]|nr:hypothetical protein BGZ79_007707 [Entomortierella chlamydospora]